MPEATNEPVLLEYRIADAPRRPLGAFLVSMMLGVPLATVVWLIGPAIVYVYANRVVGVPIVASSDTTHTMTPWAITPREIQAGFMYVPLVIALVFAYVAFVRSLADRRSIPCHVIFAVLTLLIGASVLALWTIPFWWLCSYISGMGWTGSRIAGLVYGTAAYLGIIAFLAWALRRPQPADS